MNDRKRHLAVVGALIALWCTFLEVGPVAAADPGPYVSPSIVPPGAEFAVGGPVDDCIPTGPFSVSIPALKASQLAVNSGTQWAAHFTLPLDTPAGEYTFPVPGCGEPTVTLTVLPAEVIELTVSLKTANDCNSTMSPSLTVPEGESVWTCYGFTNHTASVLHIHSLSESAYGPLLTNFSYDLPAGATLYSGFGGPRVAHTNVVSTATWTAGFGARTFVATAVSDLTVLAGPTSTSAAPSTSTSAVAVTVRPVFTG